MNEKECCWNVGDTAFDFPFFPSFWKLAGKVGRSKHVSNFGGNSNHLLGVIRHVAVQKVVTSILVALLLSLIYY